MRIEKKKNISFSDLFDCFCVVFCLDFFEKRKNNIIILRAYVGSLLNAFKVFFFFFACVFFLWTFENTTKASLYSYGVRYSTKIADKQQMKIQIKKKI